MQIPTSLSYEFNDLCDQCTYFPALQCLSFPDFLVKPTGVLSARSSSVADCISGLRGSVACSFLCLERLLGNVDGKAHNEELQEEAKCKVCKEVAEYAE